MTTMDRELQWVAGLRAGDAAAFDAVYDAFNSRLYNFLARLTNRRDVAEDLLEETWLRLVVHAARLRPDTRLAPWLFTVARNLHATYCRSRLLENTHLTGLLGLWPSGRTEPSPLVAAEANEAERRVMAALAVLPMTYREALLLVGVEGMQPNEAAKVCGVSPEAMRQRVSRARAEIVRLRCRAELARRAERARRADAFIAAVGRVVVPVALGAFSVLYAAAFFSAALRLEGWLR